MAKKTAEKNDLRILWSGLGVIPAKPAKPEKTSSLSPSSKDEPDKPFSAHQASGYGARHHNSLFQFCNRLRFVIWCIHVARSRCQLRYRCKLGTRATQPRRLHAHAMYGCWIIHEITLIGWPVTCASCGRDYLPITSASWSGSTSTVPTVIPIVLSNAQILRRGHAAGGWSRSEDTLEECNRARVLSLLSIATKIVPRPRFSVYIRMVENTWWPPWSIPRTGPAGTILVAIESICPLQHVQGPCRFAQCATSSYHWVTDPALAVVDQRSCGRDAPPKWNLPTTTRLQQVQVGARSGDENCLRATSWRTRSHCCPRSTSELTANFFWTADVVAVDRLPRSMMLQFSFVFVLRHFVPMVPPAVITIRMRTL